MTSDISAPALRKAYERHLDLMLAEELSCNRAFARWFLEQAIEPQHLPVGVPDHVQVQVSRTLEGLDAAAAGEDDLCMTAQWLDGSCAVVLVEDKLDAVLQPNQIGRYLARVSALRDGGQIAAAIIVAPAAYLDHQTAHLGAINQVSIDAIADILGRHAEGAEGELAQRLRWRAAQLVRLRDARRAATPDHPPTLRLRDWIIDELFKLDGGARPARASMRTVNTTWLYFEPNDELIFKIDKGYVDIYPRKIWSEYEADNSPIDIPDGFVPTTDTSNNLVLRWRAETSLDYRNLLEDHRPDALTAAVAACVQATRWANRLRSHVASGQEIDTGDGDQER